MSSEPNQTPVASHDAYAALRYRDFRLLEAGRFITTFGSEMLTFAIGWELWIRTNSALALGMVGLVQVVPILILSLPAGHVADQYNRRRIVIITEIGLAFCSLALAALSYYQGPLWLVYAVPARHWAWRALSTIQPRPRFCLKPFRRNYSRGPPLGTAVCGSSVRSLAPPSAA